MSDYYSEKVTVDSLVSECVSILDEFPEDVRYMNINYALRCVLNYLIAHYDDNSDITCASDMLAKIIAQVESGA